MIKTPRSFAHLAVVLSILTAASLSIQAQEIRDRKLVPLYDFSTIQMPVEIVSIKLNGKDIVPGEKFAGSENWLQGVSFTLKNISDQPIAYVSIAFKFPLPNGFVVVCVLNHGINLSHGEIRREPSPPSIQPGQSVDLVMTKVRYQSFLHVLSQAAASSNFDSAPYFVERVCFENQPDVIWQDGYLKRRNAVETSRFDPIGRYFLPIKQQ
jgi:hypothetical protein